MKKFTKIAAAGLMACFALSGVAVAADKPATHQDFAAKVYAGSKTSSVAKKGSVGAYLKPFHSDTWPAKGSKPKPPNGPKTGALNVNPPFATAFAYVYLDKNITFNADSFPGCPRATVLGLAPESGYSGCPAGSVLGKGTAAGFVRTVGALPGAFTLATQLDTRVIATGEPGKLYLFTYNETTKGNLIEGTVEKASGKWGQRIRFLLPRGLILPTGGFVSQLSSFDANMPAQSAGGKPLMTLKKCPKSKKLNVGFQNYYTDNAKAKPGVNPVNGDDFVVSSNSPIITRTAKCK